jgi:hypothetical protein
MNGHGHLDLSPAACAGDGIARETGPTLGHGGDVLDTAFNSRVFAAAPARGRLAGALRSNP